MRSFLSPESSSKLEYLISIGLSARSWMSVLAESAWDTWRNKGPKPQIVLEEPIDQSGAARAALSRLLTSLFTSVQLDGWIKEGLMGDRIILELPDRLAVPFSDYSRCVVEESQRQGVIDDTWFERLVLARPRRVAEIRAVKQLWRLGFSVRQ